MSRGREIPMKRFFALLAALCLLAGCTAGADSEAPAWQTELAGGGTISISGATVGEESTTSFYFAEGNVVSIPLLNISGKKAATLTMTGVEKNDITLIFVEQTGEDFWIRYFPRDPLEKLDYVVTQDKDGTLHYRLDTAYSYALFIGQEIWVLDVTREGL